MQTLAVDQRHIDLTCELDLGLERSALLQMIEKDPLTKYKDVGVGVIDVRPGVPVEDVGTVVQRIRTALKILAPTQEMMRRVWIDPDCGFRTTKDHQIAYEKMAVMMRAVKEVRATL